MYQGTANEMEEDVFANINYTKNIECILPTSELLIDFMVNGLRAKKACFVYAEKMDFKGLIQLRINEKSDQRRMYITTVDSGSFHELRQDQGLNVTFGGFIENLVRILQDCQAGKLEICLVQSASKTVAANGAGGDCFTQQYQLQFVEMRTFKNLIHLSLPCRLASLGVVLFYMNSILDALQKKCLAHEQSYSQIQLDNQRNLQRIEQLENAQIKHRDGHSENIKLLNQRHAEEIAHMQQSLREAGDQRHAEGERHRKALGALQCQLDKLTVEHSKLQTEKCQEHKRNETLNEELSASKSNVSNLKEQLDKAHSEVSALRNGERKHEMHFNDARKQLADLQEALKKHDKAKSDIVAELEAEKKISYTKRQALEMATEEITKANQIILKQSQELIKLKKTIGWRTEVALQQEKAICEKEKLLNMRNEEIALMQSTVNSLRQEIPKELQSMKQFANSLEQKYREQINALRDKLKSSNTVNKENYSPNLLSSRRK